MSYEIHIEQFEGPLDLLLYLVQKEEVDPKLISMTSICDQFVSFLESMQIDELPAAGEFMEMAARLLALKAQELLPHEAVKGDESFEFDLDREEILRQILIYSKFKEIAIGLREFEENNFGRFSRGRSEALKIEEDKDPEAPEAGIFDLYQSFLNTLKRRVHTAIHTIEVDHITIEDRQQAIENFLIFQGRAAFSELLGGIPDRILAAVTFMALLELVKLDQIIIRQALFGQDLVVFRKKDNDAFLLEMSKDSFDLHENTNLKTGLAEYARNKAKNLKKEQDLDDILRNLTEQAIEGKLITEMEIQNYLTGHTGRLSWADQWQGLYQEEGFRRIHSQILLKPWQRIPRRQKVARLNIFHFNSSHSIPRSFCPKRLGTRQALPF